MGLSEYFHMDFKVPPSSLQMVKPCPTRLTIRTLRAHSQLTCTLPIQAGHGHCQWLWGIFRAYDPTTQAANLKALPNNPVSSSTKTNYATCRNICRL